MNGAQKLKGVMYTVHIIVFKNLETQTTTIIITSFVGLEFIHHHFRHRRSHFHSR